MNHSFIELYVTMNFYKFYIIIVPTNTMLHSSLNMFFL